MRHNFNLSQPSLVFIQLFIGDPQRINGMFGGRINGISLEETDLHTYVVTSDGRAYTALAQIPPNVGRSLLLVNTIGGVMGWLFAQTDSSNPNEYNGFMLTGKISFIFSALLCLKNTLTFRRFV